MNSVLGVYMQRASTLIRHDMYAWSLSIGVYRKLSEESIFLFIQFKNLVSISLTERRLNIENAVLFMMFKYQLSTQEKHISHNCHFEPITRIESCNKGRIWWIEANPFFFSANITSFSFMPTKNAAHSNSLPFTRMKRVKCTLTLYFFAQNSQMPGVNISNKHIHYIIWYQITQ